MSSFVPSPDLLVARRAAAGQGDAWHEIVERYGQRIFNVAFQFAANSQEAEDLTQEIFLRLFEKLRSYRGEVPLAGWALRLSRNLCIDHYRRTRRERSLTLASDAVLEVVPATDDPRRDALRREEVETVYRALDELPEDLAEVVLLFDIQGWSGAEVATYLGVPQGTVKSRLHRARAALAERLEANRGERAPDVAAEGEL